MTKGEILVVPVIHPDKSLAGVRTDAISYDAVESILFTVQNIAEGRSSSGILDTGEALGPNNILELREAMWDSKRDAEESDDRLGFQDITTAARASGYIALLQSTPRNKNVFNRAERKSLLYQPRLAPPVASELAIAEPTRGRYFLNKKITAAKTAYQQAMTKWLENDQRHEQMLIQRQLNISRGFEVALAINALIARSKS